MAQSCRITPMVYDKNGNEVESVLYHDMNMLLGSIDKNKGGRSNTLPLYSRTCTDQFKSLISQYNVTYDVNGEVTLKSLIDKTTFGNNITEDMKQAFFSKKFFSDKTETDTNDRNNLKQFFQNIIKFNDSEWGKEYIAKPIKTALHKIKVVFEKIVSDIQDALNIKFYARLSNRLEDILRGWGIGVEALSEVEARTTNGYVDFNATAKTADGLIQLIHLAQGKRGVKAMPEEFSHLVIRSLKESPLVSRLMNMFIKNEIYVKVLGDDYQKYYELYNGDVNLLSEEAIGRALAAQIISEAQSPAKNLLQRLINEFKNTFKRFNVSEIEDALSEADKDLNVLAFQVLNNQLTNIDLSNLGDGKLYQKAQYTRHKELMNKDLITDLLENRARMQNIYKSRAAEFKGDIAKQKRNVMQLQERSIQSLIHASDLSQLGVESFKARYDAVIDTLAEASIDISRMVHILTEIKNNKTLSLNSKANKLLQVRDYIKAYKELVSTLTTKDSLDNKKLLDALGYSPDYNLGDLTADDIIESILGSEMSVINGVKTSRKVHTPLVTMEEGRNDVSNVIYESATSLNSKFPAIESMWQETAYNTFKESFKKLIPDNAYVMMSDGSILPSAVALKDCFDDYAKIGHDINFAQRMLSCAASCPDEFIKVFDNVIKRQKDYADIEMYEIQNTMVDAGFRYKKATGKGTQEFMYVRDKNGKFSNHYISKWNVKEFQSQAKNYIEYLKNQPGANDDYVNSEFSRWYNERTVIVPGTNIRVPNDTYLSNEYLNFSDAEKDFYDTFMTCKMKMDKHLPFGINRLTAPIYVKKSFYEAVFHNVNNRSFVKNMFAWIKAQPTMWRDFQNWKDTRSLDIINEEIDQYGTARSKVDFFNKEIKSLPVYYNKMNKDGTLDDYSFDLVTNMTLYSHMATRYGALRQVKNVLELGKTMLLSKQLLNGKFDHINVLGKTFNIPIKDDTEASNMMKEFDKLMDMQLYGKMKERKFSRTANAWSTIVALQTTAISVYTAIVNILQGFHQINIELFAHEYYTIGDALKGFGFYVKNIGQYMFERYRPNPHSKLALFSRQFNVMQERTNELYEFDFLKNSTWLGRRSNFLSQSTLYALTNAGEHLMQHTTALAVSNHDFLIDKDGNHVSIYDAYDKVPVNTKKGTYELKLKDFYFTQEGEVVVPKRIVKDYLKNRDINYFKMDDFAKFIKEKYANFDFDTYTNNIINQTNSKRYKGEVEHEEHEAVFITEQEFIHKKSRKMAKINNDLHGIYNEDDRNGLQYYSIGRLAIMYRKHIIPGFLRRWKTGGYDYDLDNYTEGFSYTNLLSITETFDNLKNKLTGKVNEANSGITDDDYVRFMNVANKWFEADPVQRKEYVQTEEFKDYFSDFERDELYDNKGNLDLNKIDKLIRNIDVQYNTQYTKFFAKLNLKTLAQSKNINDQKRLNHYQANIRRAIGNMLMFLLTVGLAKLLDASGDDDDPVDEILTICLYRHMFETAFFTPLSITTGYNSMQDWLRVFMNPIIGMNKIADYFNALQLILPPWSPWYTEVEGGKFKGQLEAYRLIYRMLPFVRQIDQTINPNLSEIK